MRSQRFDFPNAKGEKLAAVLDLPLGRPLAFTLFAHCFTCGKDFRAAKRIAEQLTMHGLGVLRFDFTGLGASEGEFANTHFSSNVDDLVAAADHLRDMYGAPAILIGHSLGGAAVIAAAHRIPDARAVVTIAAPFDPAHVTGLFKEHVPTIHADGEVEVALAGRPFRIRREFLADVAQAKLGDHLASLRKALLVFHAPTDDVVGIENASQIFTAAKHPKSFVTLADADHLLSKANDAVYVANVIAAWVERFLDKPQIMSEAEVEAGLVLVRETHGGKFQQEILSGPHHLLADEPVKLGGLDSGPGPYDFLLASLGACTSMTIRLYADFKKIPLTNVSVRLNHEKKIHAKDCEDCDTKVTKVDHIERTVTLEGPLDAEQRKRLMEIADKCPVHQTLTSEIHITTSERAA
ncbi:MAG TPA: bifunctional alpha/beta hydrolase/OsmC family protein [Pseudolabrys sp.]|nr:bifunctional alpha/beta hydrolase/OsmC family protein [Pseudolabrys sp.]